MEVMVNSCRCHSYSSQPFAKTTSWSMALICPATLVGEPRRLVVAVFRGKIHHVFLRILHEGVRTPFSSSLRDHYSNYARNLYDMHQVFDRDLCCKLCVLSSPSEKFSPIISSTMYQTYTLTIRCRHTICNSQAMHFLREVFNKTEDSGDQRG